MKTFLIISFVISSGAAALAQKTFEYPIAPKDAVYDEYFGEKIYDPYQWMENPDDPRLEEWLEAQKKLTRKVKNSQTRTFELSQQIGTLYRKIRRETHFNYVSEKRSGKRKYVFQLRGKRFDKFPDLQYKLSGADNYFTLARQKDFQWDKEDNVIFDIGAVDQGNNLAAIEVSHSGSDWREVYFFNLKTGEQLTDTLRYLRGSSNLVWHEGNVFYDGYQKPKEGRELLDKAKGQQLKYHVIGTKQEKDLILYHNQDTTGTTDFFYFEFEDKLFFRHLYKVRNQELRAMSVASMKPESFFFKNFLVYPNDERIEIEISVLSGDSAFLKTNWNSPNGRVLMADISQTNKVIEIVPEYDLPLIEVNEFGKDRIACIYRNSGSNLVLIYNYAGELVKRIDFPQGKKVNFFYENDENAKYTEFSVSSFYHPQLWYQISHENLKFKPVESVQVPYDPDDLETRYVKYKSKDGTEIPMYITCKKGLKLNGKNPTLMYGYGGYGITVEPSFTQSQVLLLLYDGVLAIPNIRGGGAEGSDWGLNGRRLKKQNAIDDFIAAAEYLIAENYTSSNKLAISGGSHGAMLVGATITQRPELFRAAIAEAGPFDMLRKGEFTGGSSSTNIEEYGSSGLEKDFLNLKSYSPLHNLTKGVEYPNVLLISGDNDDRVPPLHSYKFLASLQALGSRTSFYHLYLTPGSGHGGALTISDFTDKLLFEYYFLFEQLGIDFY